MPIFSLVHFSAGQKTLTVITPLIVSFIVKNKKTWCAYNSCSDVNKMKLKSDKGSVSSLSGQDVILHPNCTS